jgi:hypothetical protein
MGGALFQAPDFSGVAGESGQGRKGVGGEQARPGLGQPTSQLSRRTAPAPRGWPLAASPGLFACIGVFPSQAFGKGPAAGTGEPQGALQIQVGSHGLKPGPSQQGADGVTLIVVVLQHDHPPGGEALVGTPHNLPDGRQAIGPPSRARRGSCSLTTGSRVSTVALGM